MIIIQQHETQSLPSSTALRPVQYAGEGSALAQAGPQIANTANQLVYNSVRLGDHQAKIQALTEQKLQKADFENTVNKIWYQWDKDHVQTGKPANDSVAELEKLIDANTPKLEDKYDNIDQNPYLRPAVEGVLNDV